MCLFDDYSYESSSLVSDRDDIPHPSLANVTDLRVTMTDYKEEIPTSVRYATLVCRSAEFWLVGTCCHYHGSVAICISPIRFATNGQKTHPRPQIHHKTSLLSEKNTTCCIGISKIRRTFCVRRIPTIAPLTIISPLL